MYVQICMHTNGTEGMCQYTEICKCCTTGPAIGFQLFLLEADIPVAGGTRSGLVASSQTGGLGSCYRQSKSLVLAAFIILIVMILFALWSCFFFFLVCYTGL